MTLWVLSFAIERMVLIPLTTLTEPLLTMVMMENSLMVPGLMTVLFTVDDKMALPNYYSGFAYDEVPNYSEAAHASTTPIAPDKTDPPQLP